MSQPIDESSKQKRYLVDSTAIVDKVIVETHDTKTLRLKVPELKVPFRFKPGQFVMVRPKINGKSIPRAYSISSSPTRSIQKDGYFDLTVRQTETPTVSKWLNDRQIGDEIEFRGPYGTFIWHEEDPEAKELVLLGAGSGVTPLKSMFEYIHDKQLSNKLELIYTCRYENEIISRQVLEHLKAETPNAKILFTLTREPADSAWKGRRGHIDAELLQNELITNKFDLEKTKFYMCGTPGFCETMIEILKGLNVAEERILHEKWN